ncbi:MAG: hypothetical protein R3C11_27980 [Planctomycetaceae bacterium]
MKSFWKIIPLLMLVLFSTALNAGVKSGAAREAAEFIMERFGKEVGEESVETLTKKVGQYTARYGDETIDVLRKTGPRTFKLIDEAGENGADVVRLLSKHGNEAIWVASKPQNLGYFVKYGDDAAEAMIKHPGLAEPAIGKFGAPAAKAMIEISEPNARRVAMMLDDGTLTAAGKSDELFGVMSKYGDRAADFIWKNKKALAVASIAAAFIANPEPFLDGTKELARIGGESLVKPIATGMAQSLNWNVVLPVILGILLVFILWRFKWRLAFWGLGKLRPAPPAHSAKEQTE